MDAAVADGGLEPRARASFARQRIMETIGAVLTQGQRILLGKCLRAGARRA
jgi:hypothetical protein